jgi:hypothetical protein
MLVLRRTCELSIQECLLLSIPIELEPQRAPTLGLEIFTRARSFASALPCADHFRFAPCERIFSVPRGGLKGDPAAISPLPRSAVMLTLAISE